jgi:hypothetical protein
MAIMEKLGFTRRGIDLLMTCTTTVSYLAMVNGVPYDIIRPGRGIRQGDLISQ